MIAHKDLSVLAYEKLKANIISGKLAPGEKLVQEKLAADLGVSRMPLHRAFQMLESEMLVEAKPRRGFYVRNVSLNTLIEAFECREVLEGLAVRRIAQGDKALEIGEKLWNNFKSFEGQESIDEDAYRKADQVFHNSLMDYADNEVLKRLNSFSHFLKQSYVFGLVRDVKETIIEHKDICEAIKRKDAREAERLIREHASKSIEIIKQKNKQE
ncbi:DNA-binding transcriptional regulator, GntR family [Spirosomataceae bacterium TFI 002]|nr:DNA-binding transcriptional regulator, GntR family [Spirosomataceae bacterium TFI 002]